MTDIDKFGKYVMAKCRDEIMDGYNSTKLSDRTDFENIGDKKLREIEIDRAHFFKSLTPEQIKALDKLILNTIDNFSFCLLREFQENKVKGHNQNTFDIVVNGKTSFEMESDLISGNLFGDYFTWIERDSKYGPFQH